MIFAVDVYYNNGMAQCAGVLFDWNDNDPKETFFISIPEPAPYTPGEFYKRELPCILTLLKQVNLEILSCIVIDGHVYTDNNQKPGLGAHLWEALNRNIPVIGVAKTSFHGNKGTVREIFRGASKSPLYVSSVGIPVDESANRLLNMSGPYRIPDILKKLDAKTKDLL